MISILVVANSADMALLKCHHSLRVKLSEGPLEEREGSYGKREEAATQYSELEKRLACCSVQESSLPK